MKAGSDPSISPDVMERSGFVKAGSDPSIVSAVEDITLFDTKFSQGLRLMKHSNASIASLGSEILFNQSERASHVINNKEANVYGELSEVQEDSNYTISSCNSHH